jgi:hypothetical protein
MERWSKFDTEGVRLAKIRIYKPQSGSTANRRVCTTRGRQWRRRRQRHLRIGHGQTAKNKLAKGQNERMTRMPRNQLLDVLFALFREREQWPIKLLREKTQQPDVLEGGVVRDRHFALQWGVQWHLGAYAKL